MASQCVGDEEDIGSDLDEHVPNVPPVPASRNCCAEIFGFPTAFEELRERLLPFGFFDSTSLDKITDIMVRYIHVPSRFNEDDLEAE